MQRGQRRVVQCPVAQEALDRVEINHLPESAGLYAFMNSDGEVLYIGKTYVSVRDRARAHFSGHTKEKDPMFAELDSIVFIPLDGPEPRTISQLNKKLRELERELVNRLRPRYNSIRHAGYT